MRYEPAYTIPLLAGSDLPAIAIAWDETTATWGYWRADDDGVGPIVEGYCGGFATAEDARHAGAETYLRTPPAES